MGGADDSDTSPSALELPVRILFALVEDPRRQNEPCSLARLAGRLEVRQSTLRRALALLEDSELVEVQLAEDGGGEVEITPLGRAAWLQLTDDTGGGEAP